MPLPHIEYFAKTRVDEYFMLPCVRMPGSMSSVSHLKDTHAKVVRTVVFSDHDTTGNTFDLIVIKRDWLYGGIMVNFHDDSFFMLLRTLSVVVTP